MSGHSIYVAYDAAGRDYAYAVDPGAFRDEKSWQGEQRLEVRRLQRDARRRGGTWRKLTSEDFRQLIVDRWGDTT